MNPAKSLHSNPQPTARLVHDVVKTPDRSLGQADGQLKPNLISAIPVRQQTASKLPAMMAPPSAVSEDEDLDNIMRDVDKEMKAIRDKPDKKGFSLFKKHSKSPEPQPKATPAKPGPKPSAAAAKATAPSPANPAPVGVILLALAITGLLVAAAFYAYR